MFVIYRQPKNGEPWTRLDDARLHDDCRAGCTVHIMALRAMRPEDEILARLAVLGLRPKG